MESAQCNAWVVSLIFFFFFRLKKWLWSDKITVTECKIYVNAVVGNYSHILKAFFFFSSELW